MNHPPIRCVLMLIAIVAVNASLGCQSVISNFDMSKKQSLGLKGLRTSSVANNGLGGNRPSRDEQSLCVETAKTLANAGHAREAILLYEKAEAISDNKLDVDSELASLYASVGDQTKSIERYRMALQKRVDPSTINNLAWTLIEANQIEEAHHAVSVGLERFPADERLNGSLAVIEFRRGNREQAFRIFEKLSGTSSAYHNIAVLEIDSGNSMEAKKNLQLAVQHSQDPSSRSLQLSEELNKHLASVNYKSQH